MKVLCAIYVLLFSLPSYSEVYISKIIDVHGKALVKLADGQIIIATNNLELPSDTFIKTDDNSFVKMQFIDKSLMTVAPNSLIKVSSFTQNNPGIIAVIRGMIRSIVTKDYMQMEDHTKSKLFIRTKTAAMGIRGTEFQVEFDHAKESTSLITFEGNVVMNHLDQRDAKRDLSHRELESIIERPEHIQVLGGHIANLNANDRRPNPPKKMEEKRLEIIRKDDEFKLNAPKKINEREPKDFADPMTKNEHQRPNDKPMNDKPMNDKPMNDRPGMDLKRPPGNENRVDKPNRPEKMDRPMPSERPPRPEDRIEKK